MSHVTNLNDRWSNIAMRAVEKSEPAPLRPVVEAKPAASKPLKIEPETVKKFTVKNVTDSEKNGALAAVEKNVRSQWMDVTPEMAARWLKVNFRNRPVSDDVVKAYARDMVSGVWHPTHQGIAFNDRDELIDGQHRLMAIVLARKTVRMMVTFGLKSQIEGSDMTTMDCVDRGRTRSVADQLKIQHGLKTGTQIAQVAGALAGFCHESIRRPSVDQVLKIYHLFKPEMDFVIANRSKSSGLRSAGVLAGFAFALAAESGDVWKRKAATMFTALMFVDVKGQKTLEQFPATKQLHEFLTGEKAKLLLASMNRGVADLTLQAIYADLTGKGSEKLKMELAGRNHFCAAVAQTEKVAALFQLPK
ncbi:MAG TPA: hypothetical protein VHG89_03730 [Verrucomicrobiae bacterium]|nr:hypothetical protein [Verrucomicrobiae bacterium]